MTLRIIFKKVFFIVSIFALSLGFLSLEPKESRAATVQELKDQIDQRNTSIKQLEQEIAQYQSQINEVGKQKNSLQNAIKELDLTNKKLVADITLTERKIDATSLVIEQLTQEIAQKQKQITSNVGLIANDIQLLDEKEQTSLVEVFLLYKKTSALWDQAERLLEIRDSLRTHVVDLKTLEKELQQKKDLNFQKKYELLGLKRDLSDQKVLVEANRKDKATLLAETKNKESNYNKILAQKIALRKAVEQEILAFETQLKFALDLSKIPTVGSGVLKWPVDKPYITQYFGKTEFAQTVAFTAYNGSGHNGIDLRAPIGTPIKAAADGVVQGTGDTDSVCARASYGRWVMIKHNNGLSTIYGHLSLIRVVAGETVSAGQVIGLAGNTGYATGPHLHFTVVASAGAQILTRPSRACGGTYVIPVAGLQAYLNPLLYL